MSVCVVYLASPSTTLINPKGDTRLRYEALKYSITRTRMLLPKIPIYVFHEDYTEDDMKGLGYATPTFLKIDFSGFDNVYQPVNASKGYMMMCRFFSGVLQNHPELQKYTHYIRLDDDSYFIEPYITEKRITDYTTQDYVYRSIFYESKPQQTLFDFTIDFLVRTTHMNVVTKALMLTRLQRANILIQGRYSGKAPYNNFHFSSLRLWKHPLVLRYIQAIESVHGCLRHGWLDANIHAMIIWVIAPRIPELLITIDIEFGYRHNAHVSAYGSLNVFACENLKFIPSDEEDLRPTPKVTLDIPGKLIFATFSNTKFMDTRRIEDQAREFGVFDEIRGCTEHTISDFIEKHTDFIANNSKGYGNWIWKPKLVATMFETMKENDILVYCDAGMYLNRHGVPRFADYIRMISDKSFVVFNLNGNFFAERFACPDAVAEVYPEFYTTKHRYCYAGVFIVKKTPESVQLVEEWLGLCENYAYLQGNTTIQHSEYLGGDCDNGLFNICLAKHNSHVARVYPDETNIYFPSGDQFYGCPDWSPLKDFPFQCRRIRPVS